MERKHQRTRSEPREKCFLRLSFTTNTDQGFFGHVQGVVTLYILMLPPLTVLKTLQDGVANTQLYKFYPPRTTPRVSGKDAELMGPCRYLMLELASLVRPNISKNKEGVDERNTNSVNLLKLPRTNSHKIPEQQLPLSPVSACTHYFRYEAALLRQ